MHAWDLQVALHSPGLTLSHPCASAEGPRLGRAVARSLGAGLGLDRPRQTIALGAFAARPGAGSLRQGGGERQGRSGSKERKAWREARDLRNDGVEERDILKLATAVGTPGVIGRCDPRGDLQGARVEDTRAKHPRGPRVSDTKPFSLRGRR